MANEDLQQSPVLSAASRSLRGLLGVIIAVERRFGHELSPLALLQQIMSDARWSWLQPLYRMIVDIDHATHREASSDEQLATMAGFAQDLLSGQLAGVLQSPEGVGSGEQVAGDGHLDDGSDAAADAALFIARYRELLQADPEVAIAHATALQALRRLPALDVDTPRRRQLYRQWLSESEAQRR